MPSIKILILLFTFVTLATSARIRPGHAAGERAQQQSYNTGAGVRLYQHQPAVATAVEEVLEAEEEPLPVRAKVATVATPPSHDYGQYEQKPRNRVPATASVSYGNVNSDSYRLENERITQEQNNNAQYSFASAVDDGIMDQSQVRQEVRDGLKVTGSYSYSDGFYKRTVKYEADEKGYRVVGEDVEPIGEGPQVDIKNGKADIHTQVGGVDTIYSISSDDIGQLTKEQKLKLKL